MLISFNFLFCFLVAFFTLVQCTPTPGRHGAKVAGIGVPVSNIDAKNIISNRYIVVYNNNATDDAVSTHQASVMTALRKRNLVARGKEGQMLSTKMNVFSMSGWRGMSLEAEDSMILEIASSTEVAYVEADTVVKTGALVSQASAPAGLRRISHAAVGSTGYVYDNSSGLGIVAYIVDTGIMLTHSVRLSFARRRWTCRG
jgi:Peptidase inhibitor I9